MGVGKLSKDEVDWNEIWKTSSEAAEVEKEVNTICNEKSNAVGCDGKPTEYASSTWKQILYLTKRVSRQYWRTPEYPYSRLYASFIHSLLNGLTFLQLGNSESDMQSRSFCCYLILMLVPEFVNATAMKFNENRDIWLERERPSRIYGWVAFTTAQIVSEIPYAFFGGVLFYVIFYYIVGLPLGAPAGYTFLMVILFHLFTTSWGQWIAALRYVLTRCLNLPLLTFQLVSML